MNLQAACDTAVVRKHRYLAQYPIATRQDWDVLKLMEELGEVAEAFDAVRAADRTGEPDPALTQALAEEMADLVGFFAITADGTGVTLTPPGYSFDPRDTEDPDTAWRHVTRDVGRVMKAYNRLTGQSRPTGLPEGQLRAEIDLALGRALRSLEGLAWWCGIDLAAAFDAKWGLADMPPCQPAAVAGPR